ncbi:unnamed protein product [Lactuca virosa]|uniref:Uncharacterized protein n=1 Tax=Lactuca virosa TaxID=75947 RepID=A0AAU9PMC9_9ASTR|nr:unnamed protein product [Lactuca virosa]
MTAHVVMQKHLRWVDDGWVISFVHDEHLNISRIILVDAQKFTSEPVAIITLPYRGAFKLTSTCPIAIKYNKIFVDAFSNRKKQSFTNHLLWLMTPWAMVCDVRYLERQNMKLGKIVIEFAKRVWDGYLKYSSCNPKYIEHKMNIQMFELDKVREEWATYVANFIY